MKLADQVSNYLVLVEEKYTQIMAQLGGTIFFETKGGLKISLYENLTVNLTF